MKKATLLLFSLILFLSACKGDRLCVRPHCVEPSLNEILSIQLDFCKAVKDSDCFSNEDLKQIAVISKMNEDKSVINVDSIFNLANFNNTITLGNTGIPLIINENNSGSLKHNYEIVVLNTGHHFNISEIKIADLNRDNICKCANYQIIQLKLNDEIIEVNSTLAQLSLSK